MTLTWPSVSPSDRRIILERELARQNGGLHLHDRRRKYHKMSEDAFAFYRGSAHLFYRDIAAADLLAKSNCVGPETHTWIAGDLHLGNFGAFCDADGDVVYDLNDFDEAWIAPYVLDLWRGAVSIRLGGELLDHPEAVLEASVQDLVRHYWIELGRAEGKEGRNLDQVTVDEASGALKKFLKKVIKKADRPSFLKKWCEPTECGHLRFQPDHEKLAPVTNDDRRILTTAIQVYKDHLDSPLRGDEEHFEIWDIAKRKDAGVGSLGVPRYYALIKGDEEGAHILDLKQQSVPGFFPFLPADDQTKLLEVYDEHRAGHRVAHAQRAMLMDPDPHLGAFTILDRSFSVRERSPYKKSLKLSKLDDPEDFQAMAHHWGTILAGAHARADKDFNDHLVPHNFETVTRQWLNGDPEHLIEETATFAKTYARQVHEDFKLFQHLRNAE